MVVSIGLAGAGRRAREAYAPALASCDEIRFAGIWGGAHDTARALAASQGVPVHESFHELMDHCEAVVFAIPPAAQAEYVVDAARHDKSMLLEQPMAGDLAGAELMRIETNNAGVVSQLALTWRYALAVRHFLSEQVPRTRPKGGTGRVVSGTQLAGPTASPWRRELGVLLDLGPNLIDLLEAALGPVVGIRAHGDPGGWFGLMLEHRVGRYSEASLCATAEVQPKVASVEVFGAGGSAMVDCAGAERPDTYQTMVREFADAVARGTSPELDINHGFHLQQCLETAETDLVAGR
ncbi:MAG: putative oxidoreductase protein [Streptosporangiaceae bacterium]|jgi:predicted dehydrogenase|nr:putative oxidoreductase protein [Streptosporangiaceae bacterium]